MLTGQHMSWSTFHWPLTFSWPIYC